MNSIGEGISQEKPQKKQQSHAEIELFIVEKTASNELKKYLLIRYIIQQGGNYIITNPNNPPLL